MRLPSPLLLPLITTFLLGIAPGLLADEPETFTVWPEEAPGETGEIGPETATTTGEPPVTRITNVSVPTLSLYPAPAETANGCTVVICPGGGYNILAYDKEGIEVAQWLNTLGVTALVLKYRVPRRDPNEPHAAPLQDVQRAIRLVRQNAEDWKIDPDRLGVLGFSAGGNLAVMAGTHWDRTTYDPIDAVDELSCRPDFLIPIYPAYLNDTESEGRLSSLVRVTDQTPPTFIAITQDDSNRAIYAALFFVALKEAGVPTELHIYSKGGHGYGLRPSENPVSTWPDRCTDWMRLSGLLEKVPQ
jgi:acetyl esterase/lipase